MMGAGFVTWLQRCLVALAVAVLALAWVGDTFAATSDRILMHRNGLRGVSYQQLSVAGAPASSAQLSATLVRRFALDGDGQTNVRANMYPIDVNGDGQWEFVHFNGYRIMRVFDSSGRKLWQISNPSGRVHRSWSHRDTLAIMGGDIVHCWANGGQRILVKRDGKTGAVLKSVSLPGGSGAECQIAAFNFADIGQPLILVATKAVKDHCKQNYEDTWSGVMAFDANLNLRWRRDTCDAGHYVWSYDIIGQPINVVFVGKYLLGSSGQLYCTLAGWGTDHVDSLAVADADPSIPGYEAMAVGASGSRMYNVANAGKWCTPLWSKTNSTFYHAQYVFFAKLRATTSGLDIAIREEPSQDAGTHYLYFVDRQGNKLNTTRGTHYSKIPMQNTNLDGMRGTDELSGAYGEVIDISGNLRLSRNWYWGLQSLSASERSLIPPDQWAARPIWFDMDRDGREELITWGRNTVVVGKIR